MTNPQPAGILWTSVKICAIIRSWLQQCQLLPFYTFCNHYQMQQRIEKINEEIEVEGKVLEALPNAMFKVEIDEQHQVLAVLSGRIRMNFVRIVPGDKVKVVLSPYDLTRGCIPLRVRS